MSGQSASDLPCDLQNVVVLPGGKDYSSGLCICIGHCHEEGIFVTFSTEEHILRNQM